MGRATGTPCSLRHASVGNDLLRKASRGLRGISLELRETNLGLVFGFLELVRREHFGDHASCVQRLFRRDQVPHVCLDQIVRVVLAEQTTIFSSSLPAPSRLTTSHIVKYS